MNWFDAENVVLGKHDTAWQAMHLYGAEERPYSSRARRYAAGLGGLMVRWGTRLQGAEVTTTEQVAYSNGRGSSHTF